MKTSQSIALDKLRHYCAYQDRCHKEVRTKLLTLEIYGDDLEEIIATLIEEKYLDELRYAKSFARGKFNMKQWGKHKIRLALQSNDVSDYCVRKALEEIDTEAYIATLESILTKRYTLYQSMGNPFIQKQKTIHYAQSRGYELELIYPIVNRLESESF